MDDLDADTGEDATSRRSLDISSLEEIRLDDMLDRIDFFSEIGSKRIESLVLETPIARRCECSEIGSVKGGQTVVIDPKLFKEGSEDCIIDMSICDREVITDVLH